MTPGPTKGKMKAMAAGLVAVALLLFVTLIIKVSRYGP